MAEIVFELATSEFTGFRDNEWLFATVKGRRFLRAKCGVDRLAIVCVHRNQTYDNFESVKKDLDTFIWHFNAEVGKETVIFSLSSLCFLFCCKRLCSFGFSPWYILKCG